MEPVGSKDSKAESRIKWQWKSRLQTEEPRWTSYSPEYNYLIEKACHENQKEVDIGDCIVSIQHLIQNQKGNIISQRPIRRVSCEELEDEEEVSLRSERYFETESPKTINDVFGDLGDFFTFFAQRNFEIFDLAIQFEEFEKSDDLDGLNTKICYQLIRCLEEELLKPIEEQLQDAAISDEKKKSLTKRKGRNQPLVSLFKKEFTSYEEFYGKIFESYTMISDLYLNLNGYLRDENWTGIDNLLPYTLCLLKAFFSFKPNIPLQKEIESPMILYRGTAIAEAAISSYQTQKYALFSWNSVTSTSRKREVAEIFMYDSANVKEKKYPVLFIIEVPCVKEATESKYSRCINIQKYSAHQKEDEVILAPGSVFEVQQVSTDQDKRTIIKLKLKYDVESLAHRGLIMHGALQTEMMNNKQFKIMCLGGKKLSKNLKNISGNRRIEEIEFCLCRFNSRSLGTMLSVLPTLESVKALKFISCKYEDEQGTSSLKLKNLKSCNPLEIEMSGFQDFYKVFSIQDCEDQPWTAWRTLSIDFTTLRKLNMKDFHGFILQGLRHLTQITSLTLDFSCCEEITDEDVTNLASQGLKYLVALTSLTLNLRSCAKLTDEAVNNLASQGLICLTKLTSFSLAFPIGNQGASGLASQGLKYLTKLTSLELSFYSCPKLRDEGVNNLATQGLKELTKLTSLDVVFQLCPFVTDEGVKSFASRGLKDLTQLTSLNLSFIDCNQITDEGVGSLASEGLQHLTKLTSLQFSFRDSMEITDEGVNRLASQGLQYLTQLASLYLNFFHCYKITDEGLNNLTSQGLKPLTKLTSLELRFCEAQGLSDEGMNDLVSQGLQHLTDLTSLDLTFDCCFEITDEVRDVLASHALQYLPN